MAKVLVVGGAGYVGSAACAWLLDRGHAVWVLDDLSTGHRELLDRLPGIAGFVQARAGDAATVGPLLARERFDCVMHFAARSLVAESVAKPELYHENNVVQTRALLTAMLAAGTRRFIFSSTCAVFGDQGPEVPRLSESTPKNPVSPYGATKLEVERMLEATAGTGGLQAIALRYFNAAGADLQGRVGEWHEHETHLIPRVLKAALGGQTVEIYGTDYPTPDGTAIRDYIHVHDLAEAHGAAMQRLLDCANEPQGRFEAYNLGSEDGYSVREVIAECERVTGKKLSVVERPRRAGDPPKLIGDSALARRTLGFSAAASSLDRIVASAWQWEQERAGLSSARGGASRSSGASRSGDAPLGRKAVFLDRDGTINVDPGYLSQPAQMELLPEAGEALGRLCRAGFALVVISNQSGVGRGIIARDMLPRIHARMEELLKPFGARIDHYGLCIHKPEDDCECRKPKAKLIVDAARALGLDVARSYMVGDKYSDLQAGRNAGCRASVLVRTGYGAETEAKLKAGEAAFAGDSLADAARWILGQDR